MFLFVGSTARPEIRPDTMAGPMLRSARPENVSDFIGPVFFFLAASESFASPLSADFAGDAASCARNETPIVSAMTAARTSNEGMRNLLDTRLLRTAGSREDTVAGAALPMPVGTPALLV